MSYEIHYLAGHYVAIAVCLVFFLRHRLNSFSSLTFVVNLLFLVFYYWPAFVFQTYLAKITQMVVVSGHGAMNAGLLCGYLAELSWNRVRRRRRAEPSTIDDGTKTVTVSSVSYLLIMFGTGACVYAVLYAIRGIPILSANPAAARETFISGMGVFMWPAQILINASVGLLVIRRRTRLAVPLALFAMVLYLLSGWRGSSFLLVMMLFFIFSYQQRIRKRILLALFIAMAFLGFFAIVRSNISGQPVPGGKLGADVSGRELVEKSSMYVMYRLKVELVGFNLAVLYFKSNPLNGDGIVMDMGWILPGKKYSLVNLMKDKFGEWEGGGGLPVTILGGFFADFGTVGVVLQSFLAALLQSLLVKRLQRKAVHDDYHFLSIGIASAFWAFAFQGTYYQSYLSVGVVYSVGLYLLAKSHAVLQTMIIGRTSAVHPAVRGGRP